MSCAVQIKHARLFVTVHYTHRDGKSQQCAMPPGRHSTTTRVRARRVRACVRSFVRSFARCTYAVAVVGPVRPSGTNAMASRTCASQFAPVKSNSSIHTTNERHIQNDIPSTHANKQPHMFRIVSRVVYCSVSWIVYIIISWNVPACSYCLYTTITLPAARVESDIINIFNLNSSHRDRVYRTWYIFYTKPVTLAVGSASRAFTI